MEQHTRVASGDIDLEADLRASRTGKGVVVTHPHPLYGGNMDNPVVMAAAAIIFTATRWMNLKVSFPVLFENMPEQQQPDSAGGCRVN